MRSNIEASKIAILTKMRRVGDQQNLVGCEREGLLHFEKMKPHLKEKLAGMKAIFGGRGKRGLRGLGAIWTTFCFWPLKTGIEKFMQSDNLTMAPKGHSANHNPRNSRS